MNISFLLTTIDSGAGTERAIASQANRLARSGSEVVIHSVYRTTGRLTFDLDARVKVVYWVEKSSGTLVADADPFGLDPRYIDMPSRIIPNNWDDQFNLLTDVVAGRVFPTIEADVIVATTPALSLLASMFANPHVVLVAQEHRASVSRGDGFTPLRLAASQIDCIVSLTEASNDWVAENVEGSGVQLATISNALPAIFRPQSTTAEKTIVAAGRLAPGKQFSHLIDAFSRVSASFPEWRLRIYGEGLLDKALKNQAISLNVDHQVEIVPAVANLELEWPKAGVLALTSRSEGQSLVIMEAAAAGVPTVAYDCPTGPAELIVDGESGRLVDLNDINAMSVALSELMSNDQLRREMGQVAKLGTTRFQPDVIDKAWDSLYESLLEQAKSIPNRFERSARRYAESIALANAATIELPDGRASISELPVRPIGSHFKVLEGLELQYPAVAEKNRAFVDSILSAGGIFAYEIQGFHAYRQVLAVRESDRGKVMALLSEIEGGEIVVDFLAGNSAKSAYRWIPAIEPLPSKFVDSDVLRIFGRYSDVFGLTTIGWESAIDIEFWRQGDDANQFVGPRPNRIVDCLEANSFSGVKKMVSSNSDVWSTVNFPIDVVYTWVNGQDPQWSDKKSKFLPSAHEVHEMATSPTRFTNRDELKYSIRSIRQYAPWVRNIFVVTDNQRPEWLSENSDIKLVDHTELFPSNSDLPTFNSHAIETTLHRIPGLAEHFLYFNDDTVLLRPQSPETYFTANGLAKFFPSPVKINYLSGTMEPHIAAAANNRDVIRNRFGREISQSMLHTPHPHRKSVLLQIEQEQADIITRTRNSRFRDRGDVSLLSSLGQYYGYCLEKYTPGTIRYAYVGLGRADTESKLAMLQRSNRFDVATVGEALDGYMDPAETGRQLHQFFETKFSLRMADERTEAIGSTLGDVEA